jgi:uncharacterized protein (TIGR02421 family)
MTESDFDPIPEDLINDVCARIVKGKAVRQPLPGGGILHMDRLLPFLCIYRRDPARKDDGTGLFVTAEGAYLTAPGQALRRKGLRKLVHRIARTACEQLGGFLLLEIWSADDCHVPQERDSLTDELILPSPAFRILTRPQHDCAEAISELEYALQRIKMDRQFARVQVQQRSRNHPSGMLQLISAADALRSKCDVLGLEILPIYRNPTNGEVYGELLHGLRRGVGRSLKKSFFSFAQNRTTTQPQHYWELGRRSLPKQVLTVDRQLAEVSGQFNFLLLVTPVNAERSWHEFASNQYTGDPHFQYRPLEQDPLLLKRKLLRIRTEQVEDPTLAHVVREAQDELERQILMLSDIGTSRFLFGSLQVFGGVTPPLLAMAQKILARSTKKDRPEEMVGAIAILQSARREIRFYRRQASGVDFQAEIRDDIYSGLLVTGGRLLIGRQTLLPAKRVHALLQHEIGTHLLTYYNGQSQSLQLLKVGLAGYDALQEGFAVLSEYLVGGLSLARMRTLAARVVAVAQMIDGATFTENYRLLVEEHGIDRRAAFTIVLRVYRGGGFTKDAVYLRGLVEILDYLGQGGDLDTLLVGKMAADHIPIVRELLLRGVLVEPPLRPRYLDEPTATQRLARLKQGSVPGELLGD